MCVYFASRRLRMLLHGKRIQFFFLIDFIFITYVRFIFRRKLPAQKCVAQPPSDRREKEELHTFTAFRAHFFFVVSIFSSFPLPLEESPSRVVCPFLTFKIQLILYHRHWPCCLHLSFDYKKNLVAVAEMTLPFESSSSSSVQFVPTSLFAIIFAHVSFMVNTTRERIQHCLGVVLTPCRATAVLFHF